MNWEVPEEFKVKVGIHQVSVLPSFPFGVVLNVVVQLASECGLICIC